MPNNLLNSPKVDNTNSVKNNSYILKPLHVRIKEYKETRDRIFNEEPKIKPSRSADRIRDYWRKVRSCKKRFVCSVLDNTSDVRPYAEVILFGEKMLGLMDTGASLSCVGSRVAKDYIDACRPYKKLNSVVRTADGNSQDVVGYVDTKISFKGLEKDISIFIIPSLDRDLYLGVDFWNLFDLLPAGLLTEDNISDNMSWVSEIAPQIQLTDFQRRHLNKVISMFPSFSKQGLGRTHVLQHSIDTGTAKPVK